MWRKLIVIIFFNFPDLIAIGDIESFFNENFFKKVPVQERKIDHRHNGAEEVRFNGSPETDYEPFYNRRIPYNATKSKHDDQFSSSKFPFKTQNEFAKFDDTPSAFKSTKKEHIPRQVFTKKNVIDNHNNKVC